MKYTPAHIAKLTGITVRTLHHYDSIGLLPAQKDKKNGYRYYTDTDVAQIHVIQLMKKLGLSLTEIRHKVQSPYFDMHDFLQDAQKKLAEQIEESQKLFTQLENFSHMNKNHLQKNIQDHEDAGFEPEVAKAYASESFTRWGDTDAYRQSTERTKHFTKDDWQRVKKESEEITHRIASVMDKDVHSNEVLDAIASWHEHLKQFYDPSPEMLRGLGQMYTTDPRFRSFYEKIKPGLAEFMQKALEEYSNTRMK